MRRGGFSFWANQLMHLHITRLELEAGYNTSWEGPIARGLKLERHHVPHRCLPVGELLLAKAKQATVVAQQPKLAQGSKAGVYWPIDDAWHSGTFGKTIADGLSHNTYEDGDEEHLNIDKTKYTGGTATGERLGCMKLMSRGRGTRKLQLGLEAASRGNTSATTFN
ncbi:hypothetical protein CYMTET_32146 [Cymbomonas tetramitiformis]|uniref:Uncharacterized protein n=1 Tax=Cymbomonas tetramitiformis TaxID=36881 RepID=A0AAE0FFZ9_9CHLO|nr:hypothetical protein CYMTET_32146 [Cymbomonas tetramitiformis]